MPDPDRCHHRPPAMPRTAGASASLRTRLRRFPVCDALWSLLPFVPQRSERFWVERQQPRHRAARLFGQERY
jgi:hypothetical protein